MAKPTPEQLAKINKFTKSPVTADDVYVQPFRLIGTGYIPSRFLRFDESLMPKYLANVENGDVVQIANHDFGGFFNKGILPFGRFFEGELVQDGDKVQLDGRMYMPKASKTYIEGFTTDDINQQIESGILFDSSVSVTWGLSECSICHNNIWDYNACSHWPGKQYVVDDQVVTCTITAKPKPSNDSSCMIENSIVCAGAYPDAGVLSLSANGEKPPNTEKTVTKLNNIADLKLFGKDQTVFCCLSANSAEFYIEGENTRDASELHQLYHMMYSEKELPEGWTIAKLTAKHKEVVKALFDEGHDHLMQDALDGALSAELKAKSTKGSEEKLAMTDEEKQAFDKLTADNAVLLGEKQNWDSEKAELSAKIDELTPMAELGKKYREDAIAGALASGVRAFGNDFDEEKYFKMFSALELEEISEFAVKWEAKCLEQLGAPKSKTEGAELELPEGENKEVVDVSLYTVGRQVK